VVAALIIFVTAVFVMERLETIERCRRLADVPEIFGPREECR
jgi:hypothetical protein